MTPSSDPWKQRPAPPRRDRLRTWLTIGAPLLVLIAVVAFGVFGRSIEPPARSPAWCGHASVAASSSPSARSDAASTPQPSQPVAAECEPSVIPFDATAPIDLTGTWTGDDGGVYFVRQLDDVVWWNGMSSRDGPAGRPWPSWNNVGRGILGDDLRIVADWSDVPRGGVGGHGTVTFQVGSHPTGDLEILKIEETGTGRGDTRWTPCTLGFLR